MQLRKSAFSLYNELDKKLLVWGGDQENKDLMELDIEQGTF